jgi:hypothetical protein
LSPSRSGMAGYQRRNHGLCMTISPAPIWMPESDGALPQDCRDVGNAC